MSQLTIDVMIDSFSCSGKKGKSLVMAVRLLRSTAMKLDMLQPENNIANCSSGSMTKRVTWKHFEQRASM